MSGCDAVTIHLPEQLQGTQTFVTLQSHSRLGLGQDLPWAGQTLKTVCSWEGGDNQISSEAIWK